jgi:hypothetical protein
MAGRVAAQGQEDIVAVRFLGLKDGALLTFDK